MSLHLCDVSHYQGDVDWPTYSRWSPAAICKATEGVSLTDHSFAVNQQGMRADLVVRGYYCYHQPTEPAIEQAQHFAAVVGKLQPGEFAVLDVEDPSGSGDVTADVAAWCAEVDRLCGGRAWVYSYGWYADNRIRGLHTLDRPLWLASYTANQPARPMNLWQHTGGGDPYRHRVPGISGFPDCSIAVSIDSLPVLPAQPLPGATVEPAALIKTATADPIYKTGDGIVAKRVLNPRTLLAEEAAGLVESHVRIVDPAVITDLHII